MKNIAHRVITTEGMFLTVRLVKRRVSRYPTGFIIKTMREYMSRPPDHPLFIGCYREPPRTKVFYKCPPDLIKEPALADIGITREVYRDMFNNIPRVQKWDKPEIQGRLLASILESSPFAAQYDPSVVKMFTGVPSTPSKACVTGPSGGIIDGGALDLSIDYTRVDSPSGYPTKDENTLEEGEIRRLPVVDKHSTLAPLYAMANKLNNSGVGSNALGDKQNSHIKEEEPEREGGGGEILSAQDYAEKAIMKTMYHDDSSNSQHAEKQS